MGNTRMFGVVRLYVDLRLTLLSDEAWNLPGSKGTKFSNEGDLGVTPFGTLDCGLFGLSCRDGDQPRFHPR